MKHLLRFCAAVALLCAMAATPIVYAQVPAPTVQSVPTQTPSTQITTTAPVSSDTKISVGTLAGEVLTWVAAAFSVPIGGLIVFWLQRLFVLTGIQVTGAMREQLQKIVVNGLNAAAANNADRMKGRGQIEIKNAVVADAVKYTQVHAGETIKALGLDPQSGAAVEAIKARIETAITDPATPTPAAVTPASQLKV